MRSILTACLLALTAAPALGQVLARPTDPPQVSAASESWYQQREPVQYAGEAYYPAGAAVFFDGNAMVRTGHYNGVPLYADATRDPYSVVYVPIGRGLLQPYERRRRGDLAGTTGSQLPSFPVALQSDATASVAMAAGAPTNLPVPSGAIGVFTPETTPPVVYATAAVAPVPVCSCDQSQATAVPAVAVAAPFRVEGVAVLTARRPDNNDGLWVRYNGATWVSRGAAEPRTSAFMAVGEHEGFPVFRKPDSADVIYLPSRAGLMAPYRRKG